MDAETIAAVAAVASAVIAIVAAVRAQRAADRSVAAEERSAKAAVRSAAAAENSAKTAQEALGIERERLEHERRARAAQQAPALDAGEVSGNVWHAEPRSPILEGLIQNEGPDVALVERVDVRTLAGDCRETVQYDDPVAVARGGAPLEVEVPWPAISRSADGSITVVATYGSGSSGQRARATFKLEPITPEVMGQRMWRSVGSQVEPLE